MNKKIKDIVPGDYVKSWDFDNKKIVKSKVLKVWKNKNDKECFNINDNLIITGSHQVYTKDGYKLTKDIKIGDSLLKLSGKYVKVKSFRIHNLDVPFVHNLTVKINNYFANGILVHNGGGGQLKAGKWHGNDGEVESNMTALRASMIGYGESEALLESQSGEQATEIEDTLNLQRRKIANNFSSLGTKSAKAMNEFNAQIGKTNLATVGGEQKQMIQREIQDEAQDIQLEGEGVELKSQQELADLERGKEKELLQMRTLLRGEINRAYGANVKSDDYWAKKRPGNVFRGDMSPEGMLGKWEKGHQSYYHYCVEPNTLVDMWD